MCSKNMAVLTALQNITMESNLSLASEWTVAALDSARATRQEMILQAEQPLMDPKPAVGISYSQIKECFLKITAKHR